MKLRRLLCRLAVACLLFGLGLVAANVVDYVRFHRAIARAKGLTETELRALGNRCRTVSQAERLAGSKAPAEFQPLKPLEVTLYPGLSYASLYECGEVCLEIRIETTPNNQWIHFFTDSAGPQVDTTLWQRDPDRAKGLSPDARIVTVTQWPRTGGREWVVLENEICVFDRSGAVGTEDRLLASAPLNASGRATITEAVRTLGPEVRGTDCRADGVMDGLALSIRFAPTGERGPEDIKLANVWTDKVGPLLDAISRFAPKDFPIEYRQKVEMEQEDQHTFPCTVRSLKEAEAIDWPPPRTPWWCVWRRFVR